MKNFNDWLENTEDGCCRFAMVDEDSAAEKGWKAALHWINEEIHWLCLGCDFSDLCDIIKEELKDEKNYN